MPSSVRSSFSLPPFGALWLPALLSFLPCVSSVCNVCFGLAQGCGGDRTACPWVTTVAANVAMVGAATGGILTVSALLPAKFARLFPRAALEALSLLVSKVGSSGTPFDPMGKTAKEILKAVKEGRFTRGEAVLFLNDAIQDSSNDQEIKKLESSIKALDHIDLTNVSDNGSMEGGFLYLLFKQSAVFCGNVSGSTSFDFCGDCSEVDLKPNTKTFSASLVRPKDSHSMYALLNGFTLTCHATGLANVLALGPFLEDVVHEPVRSKTLSWMVAFECLILYLRMIEDGSGQYNVGNVVRLAGGIDSIRAQALVSAKEHFSGAFFRTLGGNPSAPDEGGAKDDGAKFFKGTVRGSRVNASKGCAAWNLGSQHFAQYVDSSGLCLFLHKCDQYVTDKGPGGQCLGDHKRANCTYDAAKKTYKPSKQ